MNNKNRLNLISVFLDLKGLDQLDLAIILKVSNDTVSRWCRNITQPSLARLREIALIGHVQIDSLIKALSPEELEGPSVIDVYLKNKVITKQTGKTKSKK